MELFMCVLTLKMKIHIFELRKRRSLPIFSTILRYGCISHHCLFICVLIIVMPSSRVKKIDERITSVFLSTSAVVGRVLAPFVCLFFLHDI